MSIVGDCVDCGRPMARKVDYQRLGVARFDSHGRCQSCAKTHRARTSSGRVWPETPEWMLSAPCREIDPEIFYADGKFAKDQVAQAKWVCRNRCPFRQECLDYAIEHEELYGTWGGKTASERKAMRRHGVSGAAA